MREHWTDARLDDLNRRVEHGFQRVDADLREMRGEMNARFDSMQRLIIQVAGGMFATFVIGFAGLIVTRL